jgi:hypothetical protein
MPKTIVPIIHPLNAPLRKFFQFSSAKCIVTPEPNSTTELTAANDVSSHGNCLPSTNGGHAGADVRR